MNWGSGGLWPGEAFRFFSVLSEFSVAVGSNQPSAISVLCFRKSLSGIAGDS